MAQPNKTLYIKNLNDQIRKEELKSQLYALFTPYGRIIDVVAMKRPNMRGQAFVAFHDLAGATAAMRAWDGELFYDKEMRIEYAKTRSYATRKVEEPGWDPLTEAKAKALGLGSRLGANGAGGNRGRITTSSNAEAMEVERENDQPGKRERGDETTSPSTGRTAKRGRGDDGEEMDMDDDQEATPSNAPGQAQGVPPMASNAAISSRLACTNLPPETTQDALQALFQQYPGFHSVLIAPADGSISAQVLYEQPEQASAAKQALDGFTVKKDWVMSVAFA